MKTDPVLTQPLDELLRRCVGCGLCLPHCATWAVSGNEVHSPRGRLLLLEDMLQNRNAETRSAYAGAFDHCIGCRACETACPSGVPFSLLEHGKRLVESHSTGSSTVVSFLTRKLDSAAFLKLLGATGRTARAIMRGIFGPHWRPRLDGAPLGTGSIVRLLGSMPSSPGRDNDLIGLLDQLIGGE